MSAEIPPVPLTKSQLKKRRKAASQKAETPDAPAVTEKEASVESAAEPVAETPAPVEEEEVLLKPSPIVDLVHKRLKATTKKISRISTYALTDADKLNDDQKRTLKTLPGLEAIQKELTEVKKAVEVHEAELLVELTAKRAEALKAEKARLADAVTASQASSLTRTFEILTFLRLKSLITAGDADVIALGLNETDGAAVFIATDVLLGADAEDKQEVLAGFFSGNGEFHNTTFARLLEITRQYVNPPRPATPAPEETAGEPADASAPRPESESIPAAASVASGGLSFMQASELEPGSFEESAEWVDHADAVGHDTEAAAEITEPVPTELSASVSETAPLQISVAAEPLDWADDEGGLPSIAGLHAKFGTSGTATPLTAEEVPTPAPVTAPINGQSEVVPVVDEDDGFVTPARSRGRGRGRGEHRGEHRGGFRGVRGGGGFRRGENRGGFRGDERGGFHGGERGGFRGSRSNGDWRGDGEGRGRGRARGGQTPQE